MKPTILLTVWIRVIYLACLDANCTRSAALRFCLKTSACMLHNACRWAIAVKKATLVKWYQRFAVLPLSGISRSWLHEWRVRQKNASELTWFQLQNRPQRLPLCHYRTYFTSIKESDRFIGKTLSDRAFFYFVKTLVHIESVKQSSVALRVVEYVYGFIKGIVAWSY